MIESARWREIKSFVRREGRMTPLQKQALTLLWPKFGLEIDQRLDLSQVFARSAPCVLEIGFGMGDSLLQLAIQHKDKNYLGVEVHTPGVGALLHQIEVNALTNIRLFKEDVKLVLREVIPDASLDECLIFFPDPWHKKRHHKRRLIQPDFIELLAQKIKPGGILHLATDWQSYAEQMMQVLTESTFKNTENKGEYASSENLRPETKFERRGKRLGHEIWDLVFFKDKT